MGLRDVIRAIREYPAAHAELETARFELRQAQQALEQSEQDCESLSITMSEQNDYIDFLVHKSNVFRDALSEFCLKLSEPEELKRFYDTISPSIDASGFTLYRVAKELTGIDVSWLFSYEDNRGLFEVMDGHQLMGWLTAAHFQAVDWTPLPGTTYESATLLEVDTSTPEYQAFEKQLYTKVLERMGFQDVLAPNQDVSVIGDKTTELKLYSRLCGELRKQEHDDPRTLDGGDLVEFQAEILRKIEGDPTLKDEIRGLMACFDGSDAVNKKVVSLFPSVEVINGELYGVAVCKISGTLSPGELKELKEYCQSQYNDVWGEDFVQHPQNTERGDLYVSFYTDNSTSILTKEEMELSRTHNRSQHQLKRGGDAR